VDKLIQKPEWPALTQAKIMGGIEAVAFALLFGEVPFGIFRECPDGIGDLTPLVRVAISTSFSRALARSSGTMARKTFGRLGVSWASSSA
jgi:hypothetical protein